MDTDRIISQLVAHFREVVPLDGSEVELITSKLELKKIKRKEYLLQPGQVSWHMRYIAQGSMRVYYLDEKSQEHTLQLGLENWWINDLYSYLSGKPSRMFIQANEQTTLIQISKNNLETLYKEVPALSDFFRLKIQSAYVALQERTIEHLSVDAYSRYRALISDHRTMEQRFPQYVLASYLGITPEFLSFLRKKHVTDIS
ncbi:Crp/Fnr family transcriptional regulator [Rhabdobacter roseus]|uniref:CRP-like cAMP-binding protein n=1 Tax=Rhabdobacter roseus TaxID=1655419 RepID=A0A840TID4_9BACT|nr:Crp/Fnr family transcriptional regulator [Rhabdobacter roseus]MBB5283926.1 CRP-like cAMP-binding protein [Rhabdobacter roseus]